MLVFLKIILSFVTFFSFSYAHAVTFEVRGKQGELLFSGEQVVDLQHNVGEISMQFFNKNQISFEGSPEGISVIQGLGSDLQMISKSDFKAYGWCFSIDGLTPDTMTDETFLSSQTAKILWYYAYALFQNGVWAGQCLTGMAQ